MSYEIKYQLIVSLIMSVVIGSIAFISRRREARRVIGWSGRLYTPMINPSILSSYFFIWWALVPFVFPRGVEWMAMSTAQVVLESCLYYALLLLVLPWLRKRFSAITCASLWLAPNAVYTALNSRLAPFRTPLTIFVPRTLSRAVFSVWCAGFGAVMLWKIGEHFVFRSRLMKDAREAGEQAAEILKAEGIRSGEQGLHRLLVSPAAATPLAIGGFWGKVAIVLPDRPYTDEELSLILRHELVHIQRQDVWLKFLMVLLTAMSWWNPLMWVATKNAARDVELGCDESALSGESESRRREYAELILSQTGDQRGFTTCLSASAEALRYRLRGVISPGKKRSGVLLIALAVFVLVASYGWIAVAVEAGTVGEVLFGDDPSAAAQRLTLVTGPEGILECSDPQALTEYLAGIRVYHVVVSGMRDSAYSFLFDRGSGNVKSVRLLSSSDGKSL